MKVAFVTDSGTGENVEEWSKEGIFSLPLQIEVEQESFEEGESILIKDVVSHLHNQKSMKTSLPKLGAIEDMFEEIKKQGYEMIFAIPICKGLSSTLATMQMAANTVEIDFIGVDCYTTAVLQANMIRSAKRLYDEGMEIHQVKEEVKKMADTCHTILLCDDLQHMKRGGRLTPVAAALGGLLKIKPILYLDHSTQGRVDVLDKVRTMKKAQSRVVEYLLDKNVTKDYTIVLAHVDALEEAKEYAARIEDKIEGSHVEIIELVSAVSIHTGLGCLAVQAFDPRI